MFITFGSNVNSVPSTINIKINDNSVERVESCKYLGLLIDSRLKWNKQIDNIITRTKYLIYIMYKMAKFMNSSVLMTLYYALFHSIATYGIIAWGGAYENALSGLQRAQNRIIKVIRAKNPNIKLPLSIKECFLLETVFQNYCNLSKSFNESNKCTRNKIILPTINKTLQKNSSNIVSIKIFNALDSNLKTIENNKNYTKRKLKSWISNNTEKLMNLQLIDKNDLMK